MIVLEATQHLTMSSSDQMRQRRGGVTNLPVGQNTALRAESQCTGRLAYTCMILSNPLVTHFPRVAVGMGRRGMLQRTPFDMHSLHSHPGGSTGLNSGLRRVKPLRVLHPRARLQTVANDEAAAGISETFAAAPLQRNSEGATGDICPSQRLSGVGMYVFTVQAPLNVR